MTNTEIKYNVVLIDTYSSNELRIMESDCDYTKACKAAEAFNKTPRLTGTVAVVKPINPPTTFNELSFEQKMIETIKQNMMNSIAKTDFIMPDYNNRIKIPATFYQKAWELVDQDAVLQILTKNIESEIADRIMNSIASEMANDIKQVLSNKERREEIRAVARNLIDNIAGHS